MDNPKRTLLCWKAARLINKNSVVYTGYGDCDSIEEFSLAGFADYYLKECWDKSALKNKADVKIYKQLLEMDSKLGTTQSEQLLWCVHYSPRKDLIEV